ncbi:hypothetical protein XANCAGTX0491_008883 [Xanthoria calcicola]
MSPTNAKTKTIIYTGAPLSSSLSWSESNLTAPLQPAYLPPNPPTLPSSTSPPTTMKEDHNTTTAPYPEWRALPLQRAHLPTGLTQATANPDFQYYRLEENGEEMSSFLSMTDLSFVSDSVDGAASAPEGNTEGSRGTDDEDVLTQYYEHSFAVHEDALPADDSFLSSSPSSNTSSFPSTTTNNNETPSLPRSLLLSTPITNLAALPSASYLHSIIPQTMTVNLLLGIIALPPPRTIITRKTASALALHELTVGDDTKAGFGINIWLPPEPRFADGMQKKKNLGEGDGDLRATMEELRVRDVVLMRNVALAAFRGRVYGQSLRRGVTRVELVWRGGEREMLEGGGVVGEKVRRVREWVLGFVGDGGRGKGGDGGVQLPADTQ